MALHLHLPRPLIPLLLMHNQFDKKLIQVHVTEAKSNDGKRLLICNFCEKVIKVGGIHRMKRHLARQKGDVGPCKSTPHDVRFRMQLVMFWEVIWA